MSHIGILSFVIFMFLLSQTIKIMNKLYYIFFSLLLTLFACDNGVIMSSDSDITTRSSVNSFSLFKDIKTYTLSNGDNSISGQIYCTEEAEYTFIFTFDGTNGCHYEAGIGTNIRIYPNNGGSFRTITTVLKPGVHNCFVDIKFTGSDQQGNGRLVITKINNVPLNMAYEGSVDLVASGSSNRTPDIGTIPEHWRCSTCGLLNSWIPKCAACGAENKEYKN